MLDLHPIKDDPEDIYYAELTDDFQDVFAAAGFPTFMAAINIDTNDLVVILEEDDVLSLLAATGFSPRSSLCEVFQTVGNEFGYPDSQVMTFEAHELEDLYTKLYTIATMKHELPN